jgi:ribosomal protein S18 acetylase RimI-like enzyme
MRIERATTEDCRAIAEVHVLAWQHAYRHILPAAYLASLSVEQREATWRASIETDSPQLLVAKSDSKVAGFVAFGPSRDEGAQRHCAEIWAIYLAPQFWSQGVGRMLWRTALERILAQGFKTVSLWVIVGNERASKFYLAAGFKPELTSLREFMIGGVQLQEVRYVFDGDP